jgi:cation diffusion facilitator CzcD-associated flavoprotein CzcO
LVLTFTAFRSDIPAHTYQATFEPNKEWSSFYATSPEIHRYWKRIVEKYGCMKYIKLKQQVEGATWDEENSKWHVQVSSCVSGHWNIGD